MFSFTGGDSWKRWLKSLAGGRPSGKGLAPIRRRRSLTAELLEDRTVLTTNLYLDFGDAFVGPKGLTTDGTQSVKVGEWRDTYNGPNLKGDLAPDADHLLVDNDPLTFKSFDTVAQGLGFDADQTSTLRANILAVVRRYYAPFDVNVIVVANSTLDAARDLLTNSPGNSTYVVFAAVDGPAGSHNGYGGIAHGADLNADGQPNDIADMAVVFPDERFAWTEVNGTMTRDLGFLGLAFGSTTAHEAGHNFGLRHTENTTADTRALADEDVMSVAGSAFNAINFNTFTRFTLALNYLTGDGATTQNSYDILAANLGLRQGAPAYVTGTTAFDRITITNAGDGTATIVVRAFKEQEMTNLLAFEAFSDVPLANGILVDASFNTDLIEVDATLGTTVTVRGMNGNDSLRVIGTGTGVARYVPGDTVRPTLDANQSFTGTIVVGSTTVRFSEFRPDPLGGTVGDFQAGSILVENVETVQVVTPAGQDALILSALDSNTRQVSGTVSQGIPFLPLVSPATMPLVLDVNDGDDAVTLDFTGGNPFPLGVGSTLTLLGGPGADSLVASVDADMALSDAALALPGFGTAILNGFDFAELSGVGTAGNTYTVTNWTGTAFIFGNDGFDTLVGPDLVNTWQITGTDSGTLDTVSTTFFAIENLLGGTASDAFNFLPGGSVGGDIDGGTGFDQLNFSSIGSQTVTLTALGGSDGFNGFTPGTTPIGGVFFNLDSLVGSTGLADSLQGLDDSGTYFLSDLGGAYQDNASGRVLFFAAFETLLGGASSDAFTVTSFSGSVTLDGQGSGDAYTVNLLGSGSGTTTISDTGGTDGDLATVNGTAGDNAFTVTDAATTLGNETVFHSGIEALFVNGLAGLDSFDVTPSPTMAMFIDGGDPQPPTRPGDKLTLNGPGTLTLTGPGAGSFTGAGIQPVTYVSIEECVKLTDATASVEIDADASLDGNGANNGVPDVFEVVINGGEVEVLVNGNPAVCLELTSTGTITINGSNDDDKLIVNNAGGLVRIPIVFDGDNTAAPDVTTDFNLVVVTGTPDVTISQETLRFTDTAAGTHVLTPVVGAAETVTFADVQRIDTTKQADRFDVLAPDAADSNNYTIGDGLTVLDGGQVLRTTRIDGNPGSTSVRFAQKLVVGVHGLGGADLFTVNNPNPAVGLVRLELHGHTSLGGAAADDNASDLFIFDTSATAATQAFGQGGDDSFVTRLTQFSPLSLFGGSGSDVLDDASNTANVFTLTGLDAGSTDSVLRFLSIENLIGDTHQDVFRFESGGSLTGTVSGRESVDTLDYSAFNAAVTTNLATATSTAIGGFVSVEAVIGSVLLDTLIGQDNANSWLVTGVYAGNVDGFNWAGVENLTGGTAADVFTLQPGAAAETIQGAAGSDTLRDNTGTPNYFGINDLNAGFHDDVNSWSQIENLTGSRFADTFAFIETGGLEGTVDGQSGLDRLDYSRFALAAIVTLNPPPLITSASGLATSLGTFVNLEGVTGSPFADFLVGAAINNRWVIAGLNAGTVNEFFSYDELENLVGNTGRDVFSFRNGGQLLGSVVGNGGFDFLDYQRVTRSVRVDLQPGTATGVASVVTVENVIGSAVGGDVLFGNNLANVLVGHVGNNNIFGRGGRDILIGGRGANLLRGGDGEDIVVAGSTSFDFDAVGLQALQQEWVRPISLAARLADLRNGAGLTGGRALRVGTSLLLGQIPGPRHGFGGAFRGATMVGGLGNDVFFVRWASQITDLDRLQEVFIQSPP